MINDPGRAEFDTSAGSRRLLALPDARGGGVIQRFATPSTPTPARSEVKYMKSDTVEQSVTDHKQPAGQRQRTIVSEAPVDRCGREGDYEVAWAHDPVLLKHRARRHSRQ